MANLTLLIGASPTAIRAAMFAWLESSAADDTHIFSASSNSVLAEAGHVSDLQEWLIEMVSAASPEPVRWVTEPDRQLLLQVILQQLHKQLGPLQSLAHSPDLARQIGTLIAEMRLAGSAEVPRGGDWSSDLRKIVAAYDQFLIDKDAIDAERAAELFVEAQTAFPSYVIFDNLLDLPPLHWQAVNALIDNASHAWATLVVLGWEGDVIAWDTLQNAAAGSVLENVLARWRAAYPEATLLAAPATPKNISAPERIAAVKHIARRTATGTPRPSHISITAAHTPREEMSRIAAHIRARCVGLADLKEIVLMLPDAQKYQGIVGPAFAEHGVPIALPPASAVRRFPLARRLLRLYGLGKTAWSIDVVTDIFGDNLIRYRGAQGRQLDARRLRRCCIAARRENLLDLEMILDSLVAITEPLNEDEPVDGEEENDFETSPLISPAEIELVRGDLDSIRGLWEACSQLGGVMPIAVWAERVRALTTLTTGHLDTAHLATNEARQQVALVEQALSVIEQRALHWFGATARDSGDYLKWLRQELETEPAPETRGEGAVRILEPKDLPGLSAATIYFAGLTEDSWPVLSGGDALWRRHRDAFAVMRAHRPDAFQLAAYQLNIALSDAQELHLSYPSLLEGRERLRSPLLEDVLLAWPIGQYGRWPSLPTLNDANQPTSRSQALSLLAAQALHDGGRSWQDSTPHHDTIDRKQLTTLLDISRQRASLDSLGRYDGNLAPEGQSLMEIWSAANPRWNHLDSTRLRQYAQCPMKFWFRRVLRYSAPPRFDDDLPGYESGQLIHTVLERFYRELKAPLSAATERIAWEKLAAIAREIIEAHSLRPILQEAELSRLLGSNPRFPGGMLGNFLRAEIAQREGTALRSAWAQPLAPLIQSRLRHTLKLDGLEMPFRLPVGDGTVVGRIDRLDVAAGGDMIAIVDYKTESPLSLGGFDKIEAGLDFQLALYLLAARQRFDNDTMPVRLAAAFFSLREGEYVAGIGSEGTLGRREVKQGKGAVLQRKGKELPPVEFNGWLDAVAERVAHIRTLIANGQFNVSLNSAEDAGCRFCDFRTICRQNYGLQPLRRQAHAGMATVYLPQPLTSSQS